MRCDASGEQAFFGLTVQNAKPKRILSVDGGGVGGIVFIEIIARLEKALQARTGRPDMRLSDVFDGFAGASVGAVVAASLANGQTAEAGRRFFMDHTPRVFRRRLHPLPLGGYDAGYLGDRLRDLYGVDLRLERASLQSHLLFPVYDLSIRARRLLTTWRRTDACDAFEQVARETPLWRLVRAATAAPTFFAPETLPAAGGEAEFSICDGVVSGLNNPAFAAAMAFSDERDGLAWRRGASNLSVLSVGTGAARRPRRSKRSALAGPLALAPPALLREAALSQSDACQAVSAPLMSDKPYPHALFSYHRLDADLSSGALRQMGFNAKEAGRLRQLDAADLLPELQAIGRAAAEKLISDQLVDRLATQAFEDRLPSPAVLAAE